jgi:hypothetical protein
MIRYHIKREGGKGGGRINLFVFMINVYDLNTMAPRIEDFIRKPL